MRLASTIFASLLVACSPAESEPDNKHRRIVSLDFCADQYVIALADRGEIAGLSPDATKSFSYFNETARGLPRVRPRVEDILLQKPDLVVRSYGGGPGITATLERVGIRVIQLGYANDLNAARDQLMAVGAALDQEARAKALAEKMPEAETIRKNGERPDILYLTSKGAVAGRGTFIDTLIVAGGGENFLNSDGWRGLPLEALVYDLPDIMATGFFDGPDAYTDHWSSAHHPVVARTMARVKHVDLPGAVTACNAWFTMDAVAILDSATGSIQ